MKILGTGSCVPEKIITNEDLCQFLDTSDEWITTRTGIKERHVITTEKLSELSAEAAKRALADAGIQPEELDLILCHTVQGETVTPGMGCVVQKLIGATCPSFDLNCACAGSVFALDMADSYIKAGKAKTILIVCGEAMSLLSDWTDRATCVLFGDGAGALVVGEGNGFIAAKLTTEGNSEVLNIYPQLSNSPYVVDGHPYSNLYMAGQDVYKFAVSHSSRFLKEVIEENGYTPDDVDCYVLHQANKRILEAVRTRMRQPEEKFPSCIERYGNISSACVPLLLDELNRAGQLKKGDLIALSAFGAGLVTGTALLRWTK